MQGEDSFFTCWTTVYAQEIRVCPVHGGLSNPSILTLTVTQFRVGVFKLLVRFRQPDVLRLSPFFGQ